METAAVAIAVPDQVQAQVLAPVVTKVKAPKATGNLILDIAGEIENLTKVKALNLADKLVDDIDNNSFKLGGVLKVIFDNSWFEGYESFGAFVSQKWGFQERKARYLMEIYENLVTKNIPWEKVAALGWSKLKDLAKYLTPENVDEWVAKATPITVVELQALLKGIAPAGDEKKTTSDTSTVKFKLKNDQLETVQGALSKAKAETQTEFDNVALEMICAGYLGGTVAVSAPAPAPVDPKAVISALGWEKTLEIFGEIWPKIDVSATVNG